MEQLLTEDMRHIFLLLFAIGIVTALLIHPIIWSLIKINELEPSTFFLIHGGIFVLPWALFSWITDMAWFDLEYTMILAMPFVTTLVTVTAYAIKSRRHFIYVYLPFLFSVYYILFERITL